MASSLQSDYGIKLGMSKSDAPTNFAQGFQPTSYSGGGVSAKQGPERTAFDKLGLDMNSVLNYRPGGGSIRYGGSSAGNYTPAGPTTVRTTQKTVREGDAPATPDLPDFVAPEWDEKEIKKKTQRNAAPQIRQLRQTVQQAMGRNYENPNVRRMTLRDALAGYGMGLEGVMRGAGQQAQQEYAQEYSKDWQSANINHQTDTQNLMNKYNAAWQEWLGSGETVTTQTRETGEATGSDGKPLTNIYSKFGPH